MRRRWAELETDTETGLGYATARYYSSSQGRFISPDPALSSGRPAEPQGWNRYAYTINNPLKYVDPSGLKWGMQYGYDGNGVRKAFFRWFDGEVDTSQGWREYNASYYVGEDVVLWLDQNSNGHLKLGRENFTEDEYNSLLGADPANFSPEQQQVLTREV